MTANVHFRLWWLEGTEVTISDAVPLACQFHHRWALLAVLAGERCVRAGGEFHTLRTGEALLLPPRATHEVLAGPSGRHLQLIVPEAMLPLPRRPSAGPLHPHEDAMVLRHLGAPVSALARALHAGQADIARERLRRIVRSPSVGAASAEVTPRVLSPLARSVEARLRTALPGTLTVSALAATEGIAPTSLSRALRRELGMTPKELCAQTRVGAAEEQLATGMPVGDVATHLGFAHPAHFSRTFSSLRGVCPLRWQQ